MASLQEAAREIQNFKNRAGIVSTGGLVIEMGVAVASVASGEAGLALVALAAGEMTRGMFCGLNFKCGRELSEVKEALDVMRQYE